MRDGDELTYLQVVAIAIFHAGVSNSECPPMLALSRGIWAMALVAISHRFDLQKHVNQWRLDGWIGLTQGTRHLIKHFQKAFRAESLRRS